MLLWTRFGYLFKVPSKKGGENEGFGPAVRDKRLGAVDPVALLKQALGAFMTAKAVAALSGLSDFFRETWVNLFEAFDVRGAERYYRQAESRKLARYGLMPEAYAMEVHHEGDFSFGSV